MNIISANFIGSFVKLSQCPAPTLPEYAFIGRSNVGKSSLINMLTGRKALAKVSVTPGKTQTINHFLINNQWYLVDLPGYGYAKVSKTQRKAWEQFIQNYLVKRDNLQCVFLLIDSRIPPQQSDLEFANWLGERLIPFVIVFTKIDDKKFTPKNIEVFKTAMLQTWETLPQMLMTSAEKKKGKEEMLDFIEAINAKFGDNTVNPKLQA
ncbi:MAG: YihA family ribosome biogenesis GTP-binding protein [Sphingobacteriales bacterium]|nr:MAG: YihA family ribosome biogenesis GTP-binding protein [Sphingobacteriales bacterium]